MARKPTAAAAAKVIVHDTETTEDAPRAAEGVATASVASAQPAQNSSADVLRLFLEGDKEVRLPPDSRGRVITLGKPGVLAQFRLTKMLGPLAANHTYMQMILPLLYIKSIDDGDGEGAHPIGFPQTDREVEALIQRLDEEGVGNVCLAVTKHFNGVVPDPLTGQPRILTADEVLEAQKLEIKK